MYCCQILVDIKIIGPYREELWIPKHWGCNINTEDSFVRRLYEGDVYMYAVSQMSGYVFYPFPLGCHIIGRCLIPLVGPIINHTLGIFHHKYNFVRVLQNVPDYANDYANLI